MAARASPESVRVHVAVVGDSGVGKTTLTRFLEASLKPASHIEYVAHMVEAKYSDASITFTQASVKSAGVIILVYDIAEPTTMQFLKEWVSEYHTLMTNYVTCIVCGTTADLQKPRAVHPEEGQELADELNGQFGEVSIMAWDDMMQMYRKMDDEVHAKYHTGAFKGPALLSSQMEAGAGAAGEARASSRQLAEEQPEQQPAGPQLLRSAAAAADPQLPCPPVASPPRAVAATGSAHGGEAPEAIASPPPPTTMEWDALLSL